MKTPTKKLAPSNYSAEESRALDSAAWTLSGIKTSNPVERAAIKAAMFALQAITRPNAEMNRCDCNHALAHAWESKEIAKNLAIKPNFTTDSIIRALQK